MKIRTDIFQGTGDWLNARAGKITGSEIKRLITDNGARREWNTDMPNTYLHRKLAEKWRGCALESFMGNRQTDQGIMTETTARAFFASLLDADIVTVGGLESDDGRLWCSPDGIITLSHSDASNPDRPDIYEGLEIKCPNVDTHVGWLLASGLPEEHRLQCQFALYVTGWDSWHFLSYCRDMPHLALVVEPDGELHDTISEAVHQFHDRFSEGWEKLCGLNGGPPPERVKMPVTDDPIQFSWDQQSDEIIP